MIPRAQILLIDPREENLRTLTALLEQQEAGVLTASSDAAALEHLRVADIALTLIDVDLLQQDGLSLVERMRSDPHTREIPIVLITALGPATIPAAIPDFEGYEAGPVDVLYKPIDPRLLNSKVAVFLQLYRQKQQLLEAQQRLKAIMDAAPVGIWFSKDAALHEVWGNAAALTQFDATADRNMSASAPDDQADGRRVRYLRNGQEVHTADLPLQRAVADNRLIPSSELEVQLPSGRDWFMEISAAPIHDAIGAVTGGVAVTVDITARKHMELALRASETLFRGTFENAPVGIAHVNAQGQWLQVNGALCRITGYEREELLGKAFGDITHPDDLEADWAQARRLMAGEIDTYSMEKRYRRKDGTLIWVNLTVSIVFDVARGEKVFIAIVEDISARKAVEAAAQRAEAALRETNAILSAINESTPVLLVIKDRQSRVRYANPATIEATGHPASEVYGYNDIDWFGPEIGGVIVANDRRIMESGITETIEERTPVDDRVWLSTKTPWRGPAGDIQGVIVVSHDITERKRIEAMLAESEVRLAKALEASQRAVTVRDQVISLVSHDLRNPLSTITTQTSLLQKQLADRRLDERRLAAGLTRLERSAFKIDRLIGELLDTATLQAGQELPLEPEEVDLVALARQVADEHQRGAPGHRIEVRVESASMPVPIVGQWDRARLERVLDNLVSNAVKYSPSGGQVLVTIERDPADPGDRVLVQVKDEGIGIPAKDLPHVFEWFARAENAAQTARGMGIGLAGVRHIVAQHGGSISVESEEGKGSIFSVRLPLASALSAVESLASGPPTDAPATNVSAPLAASDTVSTVARLERQEMWLREVLDRAPMPMVLMEPASGLVIFANRAAHEMAGGEHPTTPPETNTTLFHAGQLLDRDELPLVRAARGEKLVRYEITTVTETGERTLAISSERLPAMYGHPETIVVGYEDLTALRQGEELFRSFFRVGLVGLGVSDSRTGRFVMVNSKMEDITGYSARELQDKTFLDITHPEDRGQDQKAWIDILEGRQRTYQTQKRYLRKDGSAVWVLLNAAAMRDQAGRTIRIVAIIQEINILKEAERRLAEAVRLRDEFLTVAAHELRTPLAALELQLGSLRRLLERWRPEDGTERLLHKLSSAERASDRLSGIVDNVLDVSHLTMNPLRLDRNELDLAELVQEVLAQYDATTRRQGCPIEARLEPAWGTWDRARMRQVISHLIDNACRFGGRHPIQLTLRASAGSFALSITDHGGGIRAEDLGRIFEPFERAAPVEYYGGLGLGLYVVKRIVEAHGGRVEVESELGRGSCFTLRFPIAHEARAGAERSERRAHGLTAE